MIEKKPFSDLMIGLADNFGEQLTKEKLILWHSLFSEDGFTIEQIQAGAYRLLRDRKYKGLPTYAEFIEAIAGKKPKIGDVAIVVADKIISHLQQYGSGKFPDLAGDKTALYLMTRRWPYQSWASEVLTSELKWWVKEFVEAYSAYREIESVWPLEIPLEIKSLVNSAIKNIQYENGEPNKNNQRVISLLPV